MNAYWGMVKWGGVRLTKLGRTTDLPSSLISFIGTIKSTWSLSTLLTSGIRPVFVIPVSRPYPFLPLSGRLDRDEYRSEGVIRMEIQSPSATKTYWYFTRIHTTD